MKKLFALTTLVGFLFVGCQDDSSVLAPDFSIEKTSLSKESIDITKSINTSDVKSQYSKNFTIDGEEGGKLFVKHSWTDANGQLTRLAATLVIPKNAFKGKLNFDMIFDLENHWLELYPSPYTFDKPLTLNLLFSNVDLSNIDEDSFEFNYLDGEPEDLKYEYIEIDRREGFLYVKGAQLNHFSRYGWTRTKPTDN
ncbi:MAG: hypothetical protein GY936_15550 [Ignavibacteriae bacterium]|nr:hypothetical protein [Ignavibacteriota bacterium]